MPDGVKFMQQMRFNGMPEEKVQAWASDAAARMQAANYSGDTIRKYFGYREPDMAEAKAHLKEKFAQFKEQPKEGATEQASEKPVGKLPDIANKHSVEAKDVWDAMKAGWEMSDTGLFFGGQMPDTELGKDAGVLQNFFYSAAQMAGDFPAMLVGGVGGTLAGGAAGFVTGGFGGAALGATVGGSAGAFAVPAGIRKALIDHYQKGEVNGVGDFANRIVDATWEAAKGAITGAATGLAGEFAPLLKGPLSQTANKIAGEVAAQTIVSKGLEGELPEYQDFLNGAVAVGGLHAVGYGVGKIGYTADKFMRIYKVTGAKPETVVEAATNDATFKQELNSANEDMPKEVGKVNLPAVQERGLILKEPAELPATPPPYPEDMRVEQSKDFDQIDNVFAKEPDPQKQSLKEWVSDGFSRLYAKHLDYTSVVADVMKKIGNEAINAKNAWVLMRLHAAVQDKIRESWEHGTRDWNTRAVNGEAGKQILDEYVKKTGDVDLKLFKRYGASARFIELGGRGIKQLSKELGDSQDANNLARRFLNANQHIAPYFDRMVEFQNRLLDYVGDSGRYSKESIAAMKELNKRYIPFDKVFEPHPVTGEMPRSARAIKKIGDSDLQIRDPIVSIMKNVENMIKMAHETEANNTFIKNLQDTVLAKETDETGLVPSSRRTGIEKDGIINTGIMMGSAPVMMEGSPFFEKAPEQKGMVGAAQIATWENGERTLWNVNKDVAEALKAMAGNKPALDMWTQMLKPFAQLLRMGTVYNPLFGLRHAWRNQITAGTLSETGLKPFQALTYALQYAFKDPEKYHQFLYDGGAIRSIDPLTKGYMDGEIYSLAQKTMVEKAWNGVKTLGSLSHWMIVHNDNMIRFAEYSRSLKAGKSRTEAAFNARQVIPDFQKSGLQMSAMKQITAFLNVHAQGMARMGEAVHEDFDNAMKATKGDVKAMRDLATGYVAKNLAAITVPSVLLYAANNGLYPGGVKDDAIADLPNWQKYMYWNIHIPSWREANSLAEAMSVKAAYPSNVRQEGDKWMVNDGTIVRIQKPFTNGIAFGSGFEAILDSLEKHDPAAFKDFAKTIGKSTIAEPIPTALNPIAEHMVNRNFYTDQPIIRQSMENKVPEYQYDQYTSETAKILGKLISYVPLVKDIGPQDAHMASPKVIDNYIHGWTGTLGHYALDAIDRTLESTGIAQPKIRPTSGLSEWPGIREFTIRFPNAKPQSISDFEDRYRKADQIYHTISSLRKEGNMLEAVKLQQRYQASMDRLQGVDSAIKNANAAIQKLYAMDMDPTQKRQLMNGMYYQMASMAKRGNDMMDEFEKRANNRGQ